MSVIRGFLSKRRLIYFVSAAALIFLVSQYIASNYGLPQWITIKIKSEKSIWLNVYYDIGKGVEEKNKISRWITGSDKLQTVTMMLPLKRLKSVRIYPLTEPGIVYIKSIRLSSFFNKKHRWYADDVLKSFRPYDDISRFEEVNGFLLIESTGNYPFFELVRSIPVINKINAAELTVFFGLFLLAIFLFYSLFRKIYFKSGLKFFAKLKIQDKYIIGLVVIFVFILNYQKLYLYFLSDDFVFIYKYQNLKSVFTASASYHFNPVTYLLMFYLGNRLAGLEPLYYHAVTLFLHIINIILVYLLADNLFRSKWTSFAASLLFATFFMNYEVVYWVTGIYYLLLTAFYISTLLFFMKYLTEKKNRYYILFLTTFSLALFSMEQGITLLVACIVLEILSAENLEKLRLSSFKQKGLCLLKGSAKYFLPLVIVALFFAVKHSMAQAFTANQQTFETFIKTIYGMVWHLFVPYPYGISSGIFYCTSTWDYRIFLFILISGIISYLFIRHFKEHKDIRADKRFIFSTDAVTYFFLLSSMLVYVIPQSIAAMMQARYFYLPSVFSSILLGSLLIKSLSCLIKKNNPIKLIFHSLIAVFIAASLPVNIVFLQKQYRHWDKASEITRNVIHDTKFHLSEKIQDQNIFYANLPDGVYGPKDFGWPNAFMFRNGISEAIRLTYPDSKIGMIMTYRTEHGGTTTSHGHELVTDDQLHQLASSGRNLVLVYDTKIGTIRKLSH